MAMKPVLRRMDAATYVKDIEASRAFYELLGFSELRSQISGNRSAMSL
jgi:predicted lactoylglutathione lyase